MTARVVLVLRRIRVLLTSLDNVKYNHAMGEDYLYNFIIATCEFTFIEKDKKYYGDTIRSYNGKKFRPTWGSNPRP